MGKVRERKHKQVIIFDVGGVLADDMHVGLLHTVIKGRFARINSRNNNSGSATTHEQEEKLQQTLNLSDRVGTEAMSVFKVGGMTEDAFWQQVKQGLGDDIIEESIEDLKALLRKEYMRVYYTSMAIAYRLRHRGYAIGILSNHTREWFNDLFDRYRFRDIFDVEDLIVSSYQDDIQCAKPSQEIFEKLLGRIRKVYPDVQPADVIFVDDKATNIYAARKFGMQGICFDARKQTACHLVKVLKDEFDVDASEF
eukprot:GEZU01009155.1.p1 GENE.GEZU01009155.1~~GEZU01009155.1.p1  ORF type:complete len:253 (-),score=47.28 GEZU01009155.1:23-781(-)